MKRAFSRLTQGMHASSDLHAASLSACSLLICIYLCIVYGAGASSRELSPPMTKPSPLTPHPSPLTPHPSNLKPQTSNLTLTHTPTRTRTRTRTRTLTLTQVRPRGRGVGRGRGQGSLHLTNLPFDEPRDDKGLSLVTRKANKICAYTNYAHIRYDIEELTYQRGQHTRPASAPTSWRAPWPVTSPSAGG